MKTIQAPQRIMNILMTPSMRPGVYKPSAFNFAPAQIPRIIFHTLRRHLAELTEAEWQILGEERVRYQGGDGEKTVEELIRAGFLVEENFDETKTYLEVIDALKIMMKKSSGKNFFKIYTTMECNARCFYCFEPDHPVQPMEPETVDALFDYIMRTKGNNRITLQWFGGEPLCNHNAIDQLCRKLRDAGVDYISRMATNGSLFDQAMIRRACDLWNMEKVQITLDGMEKEHNKRKRYYPGLENPFAVTINHIGLALDAGLSVIVRLNFDSRNVTSIWELIDFLIQRFQGNTRLKIYPAILFEEWFAWKDNQSAEIRSMLRDEWAKMRGKLHEAGLLNQPKLTAIPKLNHCMADNERVAIVSVDGRLYTCESCSESLAYGDIHNGVTNQNLYDSWVRKVQIREKCRDCVFLPECTAFSLCPTKESDCFAAQHDDLLHKILYAMEPV